MTGKIQKIDHGAICARLGLEMRDSKLLEEAFTHQSYVSAHDGVRDNQRLEFLGDAVLGLLAAERLYLADGEADEGVLTKRRSVLVSGAALAAVAGKHDLAKYMRFAAGLRDENELRGQRTSAALVEALFGAVWLDGGYDAAARLFERLFADELASARDAAESDDPRGRLQTLSRRMGLGEPEYAVTESGGNGHDFIYKASVRVAGRQATGEGPSKRKAFASAAEAMLGALGDKKTD